MAALLCFRRFRYDYPHLCGRARLRRPAAVQPVGMLLVVTTTALPSVGYIHNHATLIRSGAGLAYKAVCGIEAGEQVTIVGRNGDWYEVQYQGLSGYVSGQFLRFTPWDPNTTPPAATTAATTAATGTTANAAATTSAGQ